MDEELRSLTKRERRWLNNLVATENFLVEYNALVDEKQVSVRIELLDDIYNKFFDNRYAIEEQLREGEDDETAEDKAKREKMLKDSDRIVAEFEKQYIDLKSRLREKLPRPPAQPEVAADNQVVVHQPVFSKVKLPDIRLPSFSGKLQEWICFRDTFTSLIDKNAQLTDIDRFTYLRSSLSDKALLEINNIDFTANNYSVAWQTLLDTYENKKLLVKAYIDTLFSLEPLRRESYQGLSHLVSEFEKSLQMLTKLDEKTDGWSTLLAHMICSRLDSATLREWESHHKSKEVPTYQKVIEFLKSQCTILQSVDSVKANNADQRSSKTAVCNFSANSSDLCWICNEPWHTPFQCNKFQTMNLQERNNFVMQNKLCRNCLKPGHFSRTCERGQCRHCHRNHHTMLHITRSSVPPPQTSPQLANRQTQNRPASTNQTNHINATDTASNGNTSREQNASDTLPPTQPSTSQACIALPITPTQNILLSTALVKVKDRYGNTLLARALLDSCSQHCLMTKSFSNKLKFRQTYAYLSIQGIGPTAAVSTKVVSAEVCPHSSNLSSFAEEMAFYVLPTLTIPLPTATIDPAQWKLPDCAQLADPQFYESNPIDIIIGAEFFMDLLREGKQKATEKGPTLQETVFGWIISGRVPNSTATEQSLTFVVSTAQDNSRIASLNPQLIDGLLCVGGRLQNANASASRKHPYIVDHRHPFTENVTADYHDNLYHARQQLLLSAVRGRFWATSARNCVNCFHTRSRVQSQLIANLPPKHLQTVLRGTRPAPWVSCERRHIQARRINCMRPSDM